MSRPVDTYQLRQAGSALPACELMFAQWDLEHCTYAFALAAVIPEACKWWSRSYKCIRNVLHRERRVGGINSEVCVGEWRSLCQGWW